MRGKLWVTDTTDNNFNLGIHCQRSFRDGVLMLEMAITQYTNPKLVHIVLKGSNAQGYATFLDKLTRKLREKAKVPYSFKGCEEHDLKKQAHMHIMMVVDAVNINELFGPEESLVADLLWNNSDKEPTLSVFLCFPASQHGNNFMPLSAATLQEAACWMSYLFKQRSKKEGHRYISSRVARTMSRPKCLTKPRLKVVLQVNAHLRPYSAAVRARWSRQHHHTSASNGGRHICNNRLTVRLRLNSLLAF